jgi:hypothetical protein
VAFLLARTVVSIDPLEYRDAVALALQVLDLVAAHVGIDHGAAFVLPEVIDDNA